MRYTKLSTADISELYYLILKRITFVNEDLIGTPALQQAYELVQSVDLKDLPFVATAIHLQVPLWTGDLTLANGLRAKGFSLLRTTPELNTSA